MKEKVCKSCKMFVEGSVCPVCKESNFTSVFQGRLNILDVNKSFIAQQISAKEKGKYAIKTR
jgi:DNA-directed RNA polymerase subunit E"